MVKKVKIEYFPKVLIFAIPCGLLLGIYFYYGSYPLTGIIISLLGVSIGILTITTFYTTAFDLKARVYSDYITILGQRFNYKKKPLGTIKKIIIARGRHEHTVRFPGAQPYLVNWHNFTAFLLHDYGKLELMTRKDKKTLIKEVKAVADFFNVDIEDQSVKEPYLIDLEQI
jgi:hypothetical protein